MMIFLETLGCSRNRVDSEIMLGRLLERGHRLTDDPSCAEVIIVNTCGFISSASEEAVDVLLEMAEFKKTGVCRRLIATGCLAQRYKDGSDLADSLPEVDAFLGTAACEHIVDAVESQSAGPFIRFPDPNQRPFQNLFQKRVLSGEPFAYVKVSEGCNRKCTYCVIPKLRGDQRSRPMDDILKESGTLVGQGVREIILTAENTTDYGRDLPNGIGFAHVLNRLSETLADREAWIRFLYTHPETLTRDVIQAVQRHDRICSYYDVPIQHASTRMLKKMGRPYTLEHLYNLFEAIRTLDPGAALRTTLIVGFPGETQEDFDILMKFIQDIRFDHLGVFMYSDSDDLVSHGFRDHVPAELAEVRHDRIMAIQAEISLSINEGHVGKIYEVLVEENPEPGLYIGRTMFQAPEVDGVTFIYADRLAIGTFVKVKITDGYEYDIAGEPV